MDRDEMNNLYRGPSIDASYQVSVHLAEGIQRRRLKCETLTDDRQRMPSDGKSSHCLWQGDEPIYIKLDILGRNTLTSNKILFRVMSSSLSFNFECPFICNTFKYICILTNLTIALHYQFMYLVLKSRLIPDW